MNPQPPSPQAPPPKLLDQVMAKMRLPHYAKRTETPFPNETIGIRKEEGQSKLA